MIKCHSSRQVVARLTNRAPARDGLGCGVEFLYTLASLHGWASFAAIRVNQVS